MNFGKQKRLYHHYPRSPTAVSTEEKSFKVVPWKPWGHVRLMYIGIACMVVLVLYILLASLMDTHGGAAFTKALCEEYQSEHLSGNLCANICRHRSFTLTNFVMDHKGYRIFKSEHLLFKVRLSHLQHLEANPSQGLKHVYATPSEGTTVEEFRKMMDEFTANRLGLANRREILNDLLEMSDVNKDSKISLGEAKTMWSLVQHEEVFKLLLFPNSEYIQQLQGHCGDLYAVEDVEYQYLYRKPESAIVKFLFPHSYTWWFPPWVMRAKIVVGLLEFTLDAYQHGSLGTFYMCNMDETNIGYTRRGDVKIMNMDWILSKKDLLDVMGKKSCRNSSDCAYTSHCTTMCNPETQQCTAELVKPNLSMVCGLIKPYIIKGVPRIIMGDLLHILDKCGELEYGQDKLELNHSLILNDLKLLLWKQISNSHF